MQCFRTSAVSILHKRYSGIVYFTIATLGDDAVRLSIGEDHQEAATNSEKIYFTNKKKQHITLSMNNIQIQQNIWRIHLMLGCVGDTHVKNRRVPN